MYPNPGHRNQKSAPARRPPAPISKTNEDPEPYTLNPELQTHKFDRQFDYPFPKPCT